MRTLFTIGVAMILICTSCQRQHEVSEAVISGVIQNHQKDKDLKLSDFLGKSEWRQDIEVNNNAFELALDLDAPAIRMLEYDNIRKDIFMQPGTSLKVFFDTQDSLQPVKYDGDLATENRILDSVAATVNNIDFAYVYRQELEVATRYVDSIKRRSMDVLLSLNKVNPTSTEFIAFAKAFITYNLSGLKIILGERKETQPDNYYAFLDNLTVTDPTLINIPEYRMFLYLYIKRESNLAMKNLDSLQQQIPDIEFTESLKVIDQFENKEVKAYALYNTMIMKLKDSGVDEFDTYYDYFKEHNTDPHYTEQMELAYAEKMKIAPGKQAPQFTLTDINNEEKSLSDFKGQYVLLDFWNSRCGRCRRELPHFKELEADFKNKNIAFVSISNDPDPEMWKTYVKENKDVGTNLYTEKAWDSEIFTAYQVQGTPTYVLIDKEGTIIDPLAPKPSTPELKELLNRVLETQ